MDKMGEKYRRFVDKYVESVNKCSEYLKILQIVAQLTGESACKQLDSMLSFP